MRLSSLIHLAIVAALAFLLSSCSAKRLTYLRDMEPGETVTVIEREDIHVKPGDKLSIVVTSKNPALAAPFAMVSGSPVVDPKTGEISNAVKNEDAIGYTVDKKGYINFPVLGKLYIQGLSLDEVREFVTKKIVEMDYIKDPIVLVNFQNFKIVVLGETKPQIVTVDGESIDIFQLLAKTQDLTTSAKREEVWVIRNENNQKKVYSIDLQSKNCFESPVYYLQQNDMVYVKPRKAKMDEGTSNVLQWLSLAFTGISLITTCVILATRYR